MFLTVPRLAMHSPKDHLLLFCLGAPNMLMYCFARRPLEPRGAVGPNMPNTGWAAKPGGGKQFLPPWPERKKERKRCGL